MINLEIQKDSSYYFPTFAIKQSDVINNRVLASGVAESDTVPADARLVMFSSTGNFYCKINGTAAIPAADVTDGTGSELNPSVRSVEAANTISLIAPTACVVTLAYYK